MQINLQNIIERTIYLAVQDSFDLVARGQKPTGDQLTDIISQRVTSDLFDLIEFPTVEIQLKNKDNDKQLPLI